MQSVYYISKDVKLLWRMNVQKRNRTAQKWIFLQYSFLLPCRNFEIMIHATSLVKKQIYCTFGHSYIIAALEPKKEVTVLIYIYFYFRSWFKIERNDFLTAMDRFSLDTSQWTNLMILIWILFGKIKLYFVIIIVSRHWNCVRCMYLRQKFL